MAKPLKRAVPTSSIARLFDMEAAARATTFSAEQPPLRAAPVEHEPVFSPNQPARRTGCETPTIKREFVLTPTADRVFTELVDTLRKGTQTRLTASHVLRAVTKAIAHSFDQLEREAKRMGAMKLPPNARGHELERERFEARLADVITAAVRNSSVP